MTATSTTDSTGNHLVDLSTVTTVLCDADGTLFASEEPAYHASASVTQAFADRYGLVGDFSAETLRRTGTGRNFRSLTGDLLRAAGIRADAGELEQWIERERVEVTDHLYATLIPREDVSRVAEQLRRRYRVAVVTSSASARVAACLAATGLTALFDGGPLLSAEDSMSEPISKPDPAIYRYALDQLGVRADEAVAIEDSVTGTRSAVAAGIRTIGIVQFIDPSEREDRVRELYDVGAMTVVQDWTELGSLVLPTGATS